MPEIQPNRDKAGHSADFVTLPCGELRKIRASKNSQTAATAVRLVSIAAARST